MPKRSRSTKRKLKSSRSRKSKPARDENQMAFDLIRHIEELGATPDGKNLLAVALGRLGGLKGGRARADKLTGDERKASAIKAARARWDRKTG